MSQIYGIAMAALAVLTVALVLTVPALLVAIARVEARTLTRRAVLISVALGLALLAALIVQSITTQFVSP